jgi:putative transcription antitermination factor YqgF
MNIAALDIGNRYIGVAMTDHVDSKLAYRFATIDRKTQDVFLRLQEIVTNESVSKLLLGVPYHVEDGSETQQTKTTKAFIARVQEKLGSDIEYVEVDETLTSRAAKENLQLEGIDASEEHAEAARIMLQEYIRSL